MTHKEEHAALATSPFSSVLAFKAWSLTHRPALSKAGEPLSLAAAAAAAFGDCPLHLPAALQSTPGSAFQGASYCEHRTATGNSWNGGFDIQLKSAMGGIQKVRERGITFSEQITINSCLVTVGLAGHIHAVDTPGFGCPANANQRPTLPKHGLYLLIQHEGKSFISPWVLLPQPRTHSAVSSPASHQPHLGQGALPSSSLDLP